MSTTAPHNPPRPSKDLLPEDTIVGRYIWVDPGRMSGEPCFRGTRIPVQILFDHLRCGDPLSEFLEGFPDVERAVAVAVIDLAAYGLLNGLRQL